VLHAVYCSDLQRAVATAQIAFAGRDLPILPDARLREYDYGDMTLRPVAEVEAEFPHRIREPFPRGESLQMVVARVGAFLRDVLRERDECAIVVIGHRATRYAVEYWSGNATLEEMLRTPLEWREVPIWRYQFDARQHAQRALSNHY
jgi:broad specificity phosphatase PhoE